MVQMAKSTKYFELFGGLNPGTIRMRTQKFKRTIRPATDEFRIIDLRPPHQRHNRINNSWLRQGRGIADTVVLSRADFTEDASHYLP